MREPPGSTVPSNGAFHVFERGGARAAEGFRVVDEASGEEMPTEVEWFDGIIKDLAAIRPLGGLTSGRVYLLVDPREEVYGAYAAVAADNDAPRLDKVRYGERGSNDTSCGAASTARLELEPPPADDEFVMVHDEVLDLFWFDDVLGYTEACGGYPTDEWKHRKNVFVLDAAGNTSEEHTIRGPGCGCQQSSNLPPGWLALGGALALVRRRPPRRRQRRSSVDAGSRALPCIVSRRALPCARPPSNPAW